MCLPVTTESLELSTASCCGRTAVRPYKRLFDLCQRVHALPSVQPSAALLPGAAGTGLAEGETGLCEAKTGQAEPDWLSDRFLPKAALRPRTLFRALRPGMILASLASTDAPQCNASDLEVVFIPAKRALRPRMLFRALRPGVIFASLASRHDSLPALRPLMLLSAMRHTEGGITSRRSRPRFLPKAALRPRSHSSLR